MSSFQVPAYHNCNQHIAQRKSHGHAEVEEMGKYSLIFMDRTAKLHGKGWIQGGMKNVVQNSIYHSDETIHAFSCSQPVFFVLCHLLVLRVAVINKNEFREYNVQNVHPGFDSYVITREELRFATPKLMMQ